MRLCQHHNYNSCSDLTHPSHSMPAFLFISFCPGSLQNGSVPIRFLYKGSKNAAHQKGNFQNFSKLPFVTLQNAKEHFLRTPCRYLRN